MQDSIWAKDCELPTFPALWQNISTDVLIVGGGMAGLLCAWFLTQDGVDCTLIEADEICHGVTRNTTAKITSQHGLIYDRLIREFDVETARKYWEINQAALGEYRRMAQDCDFQERDNYIYSIQSPEALHREISALKQIGAPAIFTQIKELPFPTAGAVRFPRQAQFHPLKFAAGIAQGLKIYEHTAAKRFAGGTVETDGGTITAGKIIMATHFPILNKHGFYFLKMYQQRSYVLALENAGEVEGMYLDGAENGLSFRSFGDFLLLGGGGHRTGKPGEGWMGLEAFAGKHYPDAREICRWATQDCMTLDGMPYIGQYSPRTPDLFVAAGFNKWGMTSSMAAGMILRDLVQGRGNPYASLFSPSRRMLRPQLAANGLEAVTNLLSITPRRCPHLGCALKWNPWERSWDCPCHGSRFDEKGELLDNPSTGDL